MTAEASVRIWTPINTIVAVRISPNASVSDTLHQLLSTSDVVSITLGDFEDIYEWRLCTIVWPYDSLSESSDSYNGENDFTW